MLLISPSGGTSFYPIRSERFQIFQIRVSLINPRSASSGTRMDTSNRNDVVMNEEDDEAKRRSLSTKQIKISIQLSFRDIVFCYALVYIQLMCYRMFALMTVYY